MPTRLRSSVTSRLGSWMSVPPTRMVPSMRTPSTRSFIRFRQRSSVDLPQPEGPMYAVTRCLGMAIVTSRRASFGPYQSDRWSISTMGASTTGAAGGSDLAGRPTSALDVDIMTGSFRDAAARSDGRRPVHAPQAVAQGDGEQVQEHDDQQ